MAWIIGLIALALGVALGVIFAKATQKDYSEKTRQIEELEQQLSQVQQTSTQFQDEVSEHFVKTSALFEEMTEKYRQIYRQLSEDAQSLCKPGSEAALAGTALKERALVTSGSGEAESAEQPQQIEATATDAGEKLTAEQASQAGAETVTETKEAASQEEPAAEKAEAKSIVVEEETTSEKQAESATQETKEEESKTEPTIIAAQQSKDESSSKPSVH